MGIQANLSKANVYLNTNEPTFFAPPIRKTDLIGQAVQWIRTTDAQGIVYKILIRTLVFFLSLALLVTIIGIPLLTLCFREIIIQNKEAEDRDYFQRLWQSAKEWGNTEYARGRMHPLAMNQIRYLSNGTKKLIYKNFNIKPADQRKYSDHDLVCMAAARSDNFLVDYHLVIQSEDPLLNQFF